MSKILDCVTFCLFYLRYSERHGQERSFDHLIFSENDSTKVNNNKELLEYQNLPSSR